MKKHLGLAFFSIFFLAALSLSAYDPISHDSNIYILPVTGAGSKEAKTYIYDRMNYEVAYQDYKLLWARRGSNYIVRTNIIYEKKEEAFTANFKFLLARTNKVLSDRNAVFYEINEELGGKIEEIMTDFFMGRWDIEDELFFAHPLPSEEIVPVITEVPSEPEPVLRQNLFFKETEKFEFSDDWRDKLFYIETSILTAPGKDSEKFDVNDLYYGMNLNIEMQFVKYMSMEMGVQFVNDIENIMKWNDIIIEIPIAVKFIAKPFNIFMMGLYGGFSINRYIGDNINENEVDTQTNNKADTNFFTGFEICIYTPIGIIVVDPRYTIDMNNPFDWALYKFQVGIGYKIGFVSKLVIRQ